MFILSLHRKIVLKVSVYTTNITIVLEFPEWFIQLHTSLHFLPIELVIQLIYVKRTVHRPYFVAKFRHTYNNGASVADILKQCQIDSYNCIITFDQKDSMSSGSCSKWNQYSRILHLRKCILRKRDTEYFEKVSVFKKVSSLNEFHLLIHSLILEKNFKKLTPPTQERSHCTRNWFGFIFEIWILKCGIPM